MHSVLKFSAVALALSLSAGASAASPQVIEIITTPSGQGGANAGQSSLANRSNSELLLIIEQLQDEVRSLRGDLEQQSFRIKKMERQQLDRYRDLDRRISALMSAAPAASQAPVAAADNSPAGAAATDVNTAVNPATQVDASVAVGNQSPTANQAAGRPVVTSVQPAPPAVKNGVSDSKAYREAFALVRARDFSAAVVAFKAFIRDYPSSPRVANAHYWMGEIYHAEQKLELARESFALVLGQFPDHPKAPHAAYKLGVIYSELGDKTRSDEYLDYVLKNHPKSNVAPLVEEFKRK